MQKLRVLDLFKPIQDRLADSASCQAARDRLGKAPRLFLGSYFALTATRRSACGRACGQYLARGFHRMIHRSAVRLGVSRRSGQGCHLGLASPLHAQNRRPSSLGFDGRIAIGFRGRFGPSTRLNSASGSLQRETKSRIACRIGGSVSPPFPALPLSAAIETSLCNRRNTILPLRGLEQMAFRKIHNVSRVYS